ncbi:MAG: DUF2062 domain-containing protein [Acidobacteria bacterium]|nr:DUF2062 domain-containing protein [Acidobacteriota bacterium]MCA1612519.1 DUF2062 domain-containing protein [Acidobacteriota bacterium]
MPEIREDSEAPTRRRWSLREIRRYLLARDAPPGRVAAGVALGVGIGMTPLIGLQSLIAFGLALLLRLRKLDVFIATFVMNPWTVVPILTLEYGIGRAVLGHRAGGGGIDWSALARGSFAQAFRTLGARDLGALLVGGALVAVPSGISAYAVVLRFLAKNRQRVEGT